MHDASRDSRAFDTSFGILILIDRLRYYRFDDEQGSSATRQHKQSMRNHASKGLRSTSSENDYDLHHCRGLNRRSKLCHTSSSHT